MDGPRYHSIRRLVYPKTKGGERNMDEATIVGLDDTEQPSFVAVTDFELDISGVGESEIYSAAGNLSHYVSLTGDFC